MTLLFSDPLFLRHDTGSHPENAGRLRAIVRQLDRSDLTARCTAGAYRPLPESEVEQIHSREMVERARGLALQGGGRIDADTFVSPDSFAVALAAAGACASAVDAVV